MNATRMQLDLPATATPHTMRHSFAIPTITTPSGYIRTLASRPTLPLPPIQLQNRR